MLSEQVVLITGAARGMGEAVAETCRHHGAEVILMDRDPSVEKLATRIDAIALIGDVTDSALAARAVGSAMEKHGKLTGLVNVAGIHAHGTAQDVTDEDWARVLGVNLTGPMIWMRAALPAMIAAGGGSIVNFTSMAATRARPNCAAYVASKAGLLGLGKSVTVDFGKDNIRVNTISPGTIDTPMFREHEAQGGQGRDEQLPHIYLGRLGTTKEIAAATAFLLSPGAAYISGVDVLVDGGRSAGT